MHMADNMAIKNRQMGQDLDRIFMQRKQRENETQQIEEQIENIHHIIQKRINDMEPGRLRAYNELMVRQKDLQDRMLQCETRLNHVNTTVRSYEADEKTNALRKEYLALERNYQSLRKDSEAIREELEIASLEPKDAHTRFVARVNSLKNNTKSMEERATQLRQKIETMRNSVNDMSKNTQEGDSEDMAKYELLQKRDLEMTTFIESFDQTRQGIMDDQKQVQFMIVALLEHIGKGIDETTQLPTKDAMGEMEDARAFKEKNLNTAQRTMESLIAERKKREKELEMLRSSEPKLMGELSNLRESMGKMRSEMEDFQDLERLRREFNTTKSYLQDSKNSYLKRRDTMRQQIQSVSAEYEALKKQLNSHEVARELTETENRLKHNERAIFDLREFVETKTRETDYETVRGLCLKLADTLNAAHIKESQQLGGNSNNNNNAQAKGGW